MGKNSFFFFFINMQKYRFLDLTYGKNEARMGVCVYRERHSVPARKNRQKMNQLLTLYVWFFWQTNLFDPRRKIDEKNMQQLQWYYQLSSAMKSLLFYLELTRLFRVSWPISIWRWTLIPLLIISLFARIFMRQTEVIQ